MNGSNAPYVMNLKHLEFTNITFTQYFCMFTVLGRALFSPRVDYNNKWMPVGRGDPLKKDPTYDYSPPVLDRVQYWADAGAITKTTTTGKQSYSHSYPHHKNKNDILLLGVSSKRPFYSKMDTKKQQQQPIRRNFYPQVSKSQF